VKVHYLIFGRVIPGAFYAVLGVLVARQVGNSYNLGPHPTVFAIAAGPARETLYFLFIIIPVGLYIARPMPQARDRSLGARAAAFLGTLILLILPAGVGPVLWVPPRWVVDTFDLLLALATAIALSGLLVLRHSFSIVPEARRLAKAGPYRFVRHPLYLGEILAALSYVIIGGAPLHPGPQLLPTADWIIFVGLQRLRIGYEERLLKESLPGYADYAQRTAHLVPFIW